MSSASSLSNWLQTQLKVGGATHRHTDKHSSHTKTGGHGAWVHASQPATVSAEAQQGGAKKRTSKKVKLGSVKRNVLVGPQGGKYVKIDGKVVSLKEAKAKAAKKDAKKKSKK